MTNFYCQSAQVKRICYWLLSCALILIASPCALADETYDNLRQVIIAGRHNKLHDLRNHFLQQKQMLDYLVTSERLSRPLYLHIQARTDSPSSTPVLTENTALTQAISKLHDADLFKQRFLQTYYEHQGQSAAANRHKHIAHSLLKILEKKAVKDQPLAVLTPAEAYAYVNAKDGQVLGGIYSYAASEQWNLVLLVKWPTERRHKELRFSLDAVYRTLNQQHPGKSATRIETLMNSLAQSGDPWAQATIGGGLSRNPEYKMAALSWLKAADAGGNLVATLLLASLYLNTKNEAEAWLALQQAESLYLRAAAKGSDAAMVRLGLTYLNSSFKSGRAGIGISLLEQARTLGNTDAMLTLAQIYSTDAPLAVAGLATDIQLKNLETVAQLLREAGDLEHLPARVAYGRLQMNRSNGRFFDKKAYRWLQRLATPDTKAAAASATPLQVQAMLLLGWVSARGLIGRQNFSLARSWWQRATKNHGYTDVINEVAYTLVAIDEPKLRDAALALRLMEQLMTTDKQAQQNYAYLDTWASAYAATNQFDRAIVIQENALAIASSADSKISESELTALKLHRAAFEEGQVLYDVRLHDEQPPDG